MAARVVLATRNAHKVEEVRRILEAAGVDGVELLSLDGFDAPEVVEDGATFVENAVLKARSAVAATGLPALADDSGIAVDALNGMPGVLSARWSGGRGDAANVDLLLAQVADVPDERRGASFVCAVALALPDGTLVTEEGVVAGTLLRERRGTGGFGYDPVFVPLGHEQSTAELSPAEKDRLSHRGLALRALAPRLAELGRAAG
ncbi:RdgB/HAM1 family non-canonical purine NTP pyrophosphatase [Motilibacter aurantiacus]|uniref:RdgB/HAM1 family non-canonical purine NTP pyrophosphatase n=1 Tax=Motilibacter aurantiacus TaxID=2714955 RepID=UPI00140ABAC9|nr:RdgB/HAM1 family non-canonical purine NTP pyrophosphatase [Motilibacter aurantiacus]NHC45247.1 RdgB/HAM1 family non-canonical purine NTP pyrophosphatase [Motilibacter aurantiacus]